MAIVDTLNKDSFMDRFNAVRPDSFSYEGLGALYDYLDQLSDDIGEPIEFDPIAICCEYTEYTDLKELQGEYRDIKSLEDLEDKTTVIPIADCASFIIQVY